MWGYQNNALVYVCGDCVGLTVGCAHVSDSMLSHVPVLSVRSGAWSTGACFSALCTKKELHNLGGSKAAEIPLVLLQPCQL